MINDGYSICFNEWALDKRIRSELNLLLIISSLTAENGFCYASNNYLAKLFEIDEVSVSRKIKKLEDFGYITIEYERRGSQITKRQIRLTKMLTVDLQKNQSTINKNVKDNNISNNITNNIIDNISNEEVKKEFQKYVDFRKERKKPLTKTSIEYALKKLDKVSCNDDSLKVKIIQQSIENGWLGLFPLKDIQQTQTITEQEKADFWKKWNEARV